MCSTRWPAHGVVGDVQVQVGSLGSGLDHSIRVIAADGVSQAQQMEGLEIVVSLFNVVVVFLLYGRCVM